jgi:lysophospholipase L1-like esterase
MLVPLLSLMALFSAPQNTEDRVLIVGDSWSAYSVAYGSLNASFASFGHGNMRAIGSTTAISGSTAADWTKPSYQRLIVDALNLNPDIEVVHLTIGGNDFFAGWSVSMGANAETALFKGIADDVLNVVEFIKAQDPQLQVVLSTYDYPNFDEMLAANPFYSFLWAAMGFPTPLELNTAAVRGQRLIGKSLIGADRIKIIHHFGLAHFLRGYARLGIAPRSLPQPRQWSKSGKTPVAGGDLSLNGTPEWMYDAIHLNSTGYFWVAQHCTALYYDAWFKAHP